jgi:hypothetical protein
MILKRSTRPGKSCGSAEVEQWPVFGLRVVGRQDVSVITAAMGARRALLAAFPSEEMVRP